MDTEKELTPVVYGESPVKVLFFRADADTEVFPRHWHDRIELHLVRSGSLILNCNGEETVVAAGEISVVSPTFTHGGVSGEDGVEYYVVMFDIKELYDDTSSYKRYVKSILEGKVHFKPKTDVHRIIGVAEEIIEMYNHRKEYHPLEMTGCLYRLLGLLCRHCAISAPSAQPSFETFDNVIQYINANYAKAISVDTISKEFHYEKAYFCRKFKSTTGINATQYIRVFRLEHARYLLENTDKSILNIALSCGFRDSAYFINCFKKLYNTTPAKYRTARHDNDFTPPSAVQKVLQQAKRR